MMTLRRIMAALRMAREITAEYLDEVRRVHALRNWESQPVYARVRTKRRW